MIQPEWCDIKSNIVVNDLLGIKITMNMVLKVKVQKQGRNVSYKDFQFFRTNTLSVQVANSTEPMLPVL